MNANLKSLKIKPLFAQIQKKYGKHAIFGVILLVLLSYLVVMFRISMLAKAEPGPEQTTAIQSAIPKVDQKAIDQAQSLENNNTQIHTLFEQARNNPFQE